MTDSSDRREKETGFLEVFLDKIYDIVVEGSVPGVCSPAELADYYRTKYKSIEEAAYALVRWQNTKCAVDGFLTSLPGLAFIPLTLPLNVVSTATLQIQTVASIAVLGGYDLKDDRIRALVLTCLSGDQSNGIINKKIVTASEALEKGTFKANPDGMFVRVGGTVVLKLITKFSEKDFVRFGRIVPLIGGAICAFVDGCASNIIGNLAINTFIRIEDKSKID